MFQFSFNTDNIINFKLNEDNKILRDCNIYVKDFISNITIYKTVMTLQSNNSYWIKPFSSDFINLSDKKYGPILIEFYDSLGLNLIFRDTINPEHKPSQKYPFIMNIDKNNLCFPLYSMYFIDKIYDNLNINNTEVALCLGEKNDIFDFYLKYQCLINTVIYNEDINNEMFDNKSSYDILYLNINCEKDTQKLSDLTLQNVAKCKNIIIEYKNNISENINVITNKLSNLNYSYIIKTVDFKNESSVYDHNGIIVAVQKKYEQIKHDFSSYSFVFRDMTIKQVENYYDNIIQQGVKFEVSNIIVFINDDNIQSKYKFKIYENIIDDNEFIIKHLNEIVNTEKIIIISKNDNINLCNLNEAIFDCDYCKLGKESSYRSKTFLNITNKLLSNVTEFYDSDNMIEEYKRMFDLEGILFFNNKFSKFNQIFDENKIEFINKQVTASGKKIPEHGRDGFIPVLNNLYKRQNPVLLEIGTQRSYSMGDGCSTTLLGWYCKNYSGHLWTVDIDTSFSEKNIKELKLDKNVTVVQQDAMIFVETFKERIDFLYLDAWDWGPTNEDRKIAEEMHIKFFKLVEPLLKDDAIILIDDIVNQETYDGKGKQLIPYMLESGYELIHTSYQFLFKKKKQKTCPICGQFNELNKKLVICKNCDIAYSSHNFSEIEVYEKYQDMSLPQFHLSTPKSLDEAQNNIQLARKDWQEIISSQIIENKELTFIVDIGCGWGKFLYDMKINHKCDVLGFELTKDNIKFANDQLNIIVTDIKFEKFKFNKNPDIITAFHVLEHLIDPLNIINKINTSLIDGGYFLGSVPNINSFASKKLGDKWPWLEFNYHNIFFNVESLINIFESFGFEIIKIWTKTDFNDFPISIYNNLLEIYDINDLKNKVDKLDKVLLGEEIRFIVRKPTFERLSKDVVKNYLFTYYDKKQCDLPIIKPIVADCVVNPVQGLGDTLVLTHIPKQAEAIGKMITITANEDNKYFYDIIKFNEHYNNTAINTANSIVSVSEFAKYNWGPGHVIQRMQKALGIEVQSKPTPYINYKSDKKINKSIIFHFETGDRTWHSEVMKRPVGNITLKNLEVIKKFIKLNDYECLEISKNKSFLDNIDKVKQFKNKKIEELIKEIAKYEYFIGVNSGIMHLAVALGLKCIIISNFPDAIDFNLPKLKYTSKDFELEWCYPQNVHLYQDNNNNKLVPQLNILNLQRAIEGKIYPYWSDEFLDIIFDYEQK